MSAAVLKVIAALCMLIDHVGYWFFPHADLLRIIGRIAFPIYAFCIAEGCFRTRSRGQYLFRLALFALISELPFDLYFFPGFDLLGQANVGFTLLFGAAGLMLWQRWEGRPGLRLVALAATAGLALTAYVLDTDYSAAGVMMIFLFGLVWELPERYRPAGRTAALLLGVILLMCMGSWDLEWFALLAAPLLIFYNGQRGKLPLPRYFFYAYYPAHLILLILIRGLIAY